MYVTTHDPIPPFSLIPNPTAPRHPPTQRSALNPTHPPVAANPSNCASYIPTPPPNIIPLGLFKLPLTWLTLLCPYAPFTARKAQGGIYTPYMACGAAYVWILGPLPYPLAPSLLYQCVLNSPSLLRACLCGHVFGMYVNNSHRLWNQVLLGGR